MSGVCDRHNGHRLGNLKELDRLENSCIDWSIILRWILKKQRESVKWNYVSQDRDKWRAQLNTVMKFLVPKNVDNFFISWGFSRITLVHGVLRLSWPWLSTMRSAEAWRFVPWEKFTETPNKCSFFRQDEEWRSMFLRNVGKFKKYYTAASHHRKIYSLISFSF
jgi:hypothetical protein